MGVAATAAFVTGAARQGNISGRAAAVGTVLSCNGEDGTLTTHAKRWPVTLYHASNTRPVCADPTDAMIEHAAVEDTVLSIILKMAQAWWCRRYNAAHNAIHEATV